MNLIKSEYTLYLKNIKYIDTKIIYRKNDYSKIDRQMGS